MFIVHCAEMPRRLEIRTTILGKKSEDRTRRKDANANDLYADEALQLLEQIEQLKSNVRLIYVSYQLFIHRLVSTLMKWNTCSWFSVRPTGGPPSCKHLITFSVLSPDSKDRWKDPWHIHRQITFQSKEEKVRCPCKKGCLWCLLPSHGWVLTPYNINYLSPNFLTGEIIMFIIYQLEDSTKKCPAHDFKHPFGIGGEIGRRKFERDENVNGRRFSF